MCQSYRNCYDLVITSLSIPWLFMYIISCNSTNDSQSEKDSFTERTYTYGVILILMRFFSICGKHVSQHK